MKEKEEKGEGMVAEPESVDDQIASMLGETAGTTDSLPEAAVAEGDKPTGESTGADVDSEVTVAEQEGETVGGDKEEGEVEEGELEEETVDALELAENMAAEMSKGVAEQKIEEHAEEHGGDLESKRVQPVELRVSEDEHDSAITTPGKFNELVFGRIREYIGQERQNIVRNTISSIMPMVEQAINIRMAAADFYLANPDLRRAKTFVGMVASEVFSKNPDKGLEECFKLTGDEVRRRLKIEKKQTGKASGRTELEEAKSPAVVSRGRRQSRKPEPPKLTDMQAQIGEMINRGTR